jgi:hypothetical protein
VAARSAATQVLVGGIAGPNDVIATIPAGFTHPGFKPLATNIGPEAGGRPYSIDNIRKFYGVNSKTRYRDPATWPFTEDIGLGDLAKAGQLKALVTGLTKVATIPDDVVGLPAELASVKVTEDPQVGGLGQQKNLYAKATQTHIPNFISVQGSAHSFGFAHGEYLGMFFMGGFRLAGMKNPAAKRDAYFELCSDGVKIQYTGGLAGGRRSRRSRRSGRKTRRV